VKRIRSINAPTGTFSMQLLQLIYAGNHTYIATDNGCSKSITVTINAAPVEIAFTALLLNPNVLVKRIRISTPTGELELLLSMQLLQLI
jgi:hypothetical protein